MTPLCDHDRVDSQGVRLAFMKIFTARLRAIADPERLRNSSVSVGTTSRPSQFRFANSTMGETLAMISPTDETTTSSNTSSIAIPTETTTRTTIATWMSSA